MHLQKIMKIFLPLVGRRNLPEQSIMTKWKKRIDILNNIKKIYIAKDNKVKKQNICNTSVNNVNVKYP